MTQGSVKDTTGYVNYVYNISARGVTQVSSQLLGLSGVASSILGQLAFQTTSYLSETEGALMTMGVVATAGLTKATQQAMEFDQALSTISAISGKSGTAIDDLGEQAMDMSEKFGVAVGDMTKGLESLARAGVSAGNMSAILEQAMGLSKLEGLSLETAINDLISTTNLLDTKGLDLESPEYAEAVKYQNQKITATSEAAPINAQDIIHTLEHVGGYASSTNIDQDDLYAVIAQLGSKGTKSEIAGTSLRAFLAAGQKDTAQRALKRIGLNVKDLWKNDDTIMSITDMKDVLDEAMESKGYTQQEKLEFYSDFAGYKQANQIMKIDTTSAREFKEKIDRSWDIGKKIETVIGTAETNFQGMVQAGLNFVTKVGKPLLPIISTVSWITKNIIGFIDKIPGSHLLVTSGLVLLAIKGISTIFNKIGPQLLESTNNVATMSDFFNDIRESLEKSFFIMKNWNNIDVLQDEAFEIEVNRIDNEDRIKYYQEQGYDVKTPEEIIKLRNKADDEEIIARKRARLEAAAVKKEKEDKKDERVGKNRKSTPKKKSYEAITKPMGEIKGVLDNIYGVIEQFNTDNTGTTVLETQTTIDTSSIEQKIDSLIKVTSVLYSISNDINSFKDTTNIETKTKIDDNIINDLKRHTWNVRVIGPVATLTKAEREKKWKEEGWTMYDFYYKKPSHMKPHASTGQVFGGRSRYSYHDDSYEDHHMSSDAQRRRGKQKQADARRQRNQRKKKEWRTKRGPVYGETPTPDYEEDGSYGFNTTMNNIQPRHSNFDVGVKKSDFRTAKGRVSGIIRRYDRQHKGAEIGSVEKLTDIFLKDQNSPIIKEIKSLMTESWGDQAEKNLSDLFKQMAPIRTRGTVRLSDSDFIDLKFEETGSETLDSIGSRIGEKLKQYQDFMNNIGFSFSSDLDVEKDMKELEKVRSQILKVFGEARLNLSETNPQELQDVILSLNSTYRVPTKSNIAILADAFGLLGEGNITKENIFSNNGSFSEVVKPEFESKVNLEQAALVLGSIYQSPLMQSLESIQATAGINDSDFLTDVVSVFNETMKQHSDLQLSMRALQTHKTSGKLIKGNNKLENIIYSLAAESADNEDQDALASFVIDFTENMQHFYGIQDETTRKTIDKAKDYDAAVRKSIEKEMAENPEQMLYMSEEEGVFTIEDAGRHSERASSIGNSKRVSAGEEYGSDYDPHSEMYEYKFDENNESYDMYGKNRDKDLGTVASGYTLQQLLGKHGTTINDIAEILHGQKEGNVKDAETALEYFLSKLNTREDRNELLASFGLAKGNRVNINALDPSATENNQYYNTQYGRNTAFFNGVELGTLNPNKGGYTYHVMKLFEDLDPLLKKMSAIQHELQLATDIDFLRELGLLEEEFEDTTSFLRAIHHLIADVHVKGKALQNRHRGYRGLGDADTPGATTGIAIREQGNVAANKNVGKILPHPKIDETEHAGKNYVKERLENRPLSTIAHMAAPLRTRAALPETGGMKLGIKHVTTGMSKEEYENSIFSEIPWLMMRAKSPEEVMYALDGQNDKGDIATWLKNEAGNYANIWTPEAMLKRTASIEMGNVIQSLGSLALYDKTSGEEGDEHIITQANVKDIAANNLSDSMLDVVDFMYQSQGFSTLKDLKLKAGSNYDEFSAQVRRRMDTAAPEEDFEADEQANNQFKRWVNDEELERLKKEGLFLDDNDFVHDANGNAIKRMHGKGDNKEQQHLIYDWEALRLSKEEIGQQYTVMMMANAMLAQEKMTQKMAADSDVYNEFTAQIRDLSGTILVDPKAFLSMNSDDLVAYGATKDIGFKQITEALDVLTSTDVSPEKITALLQDVTVGDLGSEFISKLEERGYYTDLDDETFYATNVATIAESFGGTYELVVDILKDIVFSMSQIREMNQIFDSKGVIAQSVQEETLNAMAEVEAEKYNTDAKKELAILKKNVDINKKKSGLGMSMGDDFGMNPMTGVISGVAPGDSFEKTDVSMPYSIQDNTPDMWKQGFAAPFVDDVKDFIANSADLTKEQYENLAEGLAPDVRDFVMQYKDRIVGFHYGSETMKGVKEDIHQFLTDRFNAQAKEQNLGDVTAQKKVFDEINYETPNYNSGYKETAEDKTYLVPEDVFILDSNPTMPLLKNKNKYEKAKTQEDYNREYAQAEIEAGYISPSDVFSVDDNYYSHPELRASNKEKKISQSVRTSKAKRKDQAKINKKARFNEAVAEAAQSNLEFKFIPLTNGTVLDQTTGKKVSLINPQTGKEMSQEEVIQAQALDLAQNMGVAFKKVTYGGSKKQPTAFGSMSSDGVMTLDLTYDEVKRGSGDLINTVAHEAAHYLFGHDTEGFNNRMNEIISQNINNDIDEKTKEKIIQKLSLRMRDVHGLKRDANTSLSGAERNRAEDLVNELLQDPLRIIKEYQSAKVSTNVSKGRGSAVVDRKFYESLLELLGLDDIIGQDTENIEKAIQDVMPIMIETIASSPAATSIEYTSGYGKQDLQEARQKLVPKEIIQSKRKKDHVYVKSPSQEEKKNINQAEDDDGSVWTKGSHDNTSVVKTGEGTKFSNTNFNSEITRQTNNQHRVINEIMGLRNAYKMFVNNAEEEIIEETTEEVKKKTNNVKSTPTSVADMYGAEDYINMYGEKKDVKKSLVGMKGYTNLQKELDKETQKLIDERNKAAWGTSESKTSNETILALPPSQKYQQGRTQAQNIADYIRSQVTQVTSFTANKVSGIIDTSKNKEANELLGGINNNLTDTTELLKGANSVLDEFTGVFPPLTIAVLGLSAVISGIGKIASLNDKFNKFIELGTVMENDPTKVVKNLFGHKITGETNIGQITMAASSGLSKLFLAIESFIANNLGPLLLIVGAFTAIKTALDWSYKSHEKYVKQLEDEEKTTKSRSKALQTITAQSKMEYERNSNEKQDDVLARRYALNKQKLDSANISRTTTALKLTGAQNDTLWGKYGITASLDKMQGKYESTAAEYDGTSGQIRRIKEHTTGGQGLVRGLPGYYSQAEEMVAAYYDANQLAIGVMDEYKDELGELYDSETNAMRAHPDENPRETKEFQQALDKFTEATGITKEHAQQYLDYMQTEHNVDNASQAMQAQADLISANTEMKIQAIAFGGNPSDVLGLNGIEAQQNAMVQAQADMIQLELSSQLWWKAVYSTITAPIRLVIAPIFSIAHILAAIWSFITGNWDAAGMHMKQAGTSLNVLGETNTYWSAWANAESTDFNSIGQSAIDENDRANYGNAAATGHKGGPLVPIPEDNSIFGFHIVGWPPGPNGAHGVKDHKDQLKENSQQSFLSQLVSPIVGFLGTIKTIVLSILTLIGAKLLIDKTNIISKLPDFMQGPIAKVSGIGHAFYDIFMPEKAKKAISLTQGLMHGVGSSVYHGIEERIPQSWRDKFNTAKEWIKNKVGLGEDEGITEENDPVGAATIKSKDILQQIFDWLIGKYGENKEKEEESKPRKKISIEDATEDDSEDVPVKKRKKIEIEDMDEERRNPAEIASLLYHQGHITLSDYYQRLNEQNVNPMQNLLGNLNSITWIDNQNASKGAMDGMGNMQLNAFDAENNPVGILSTFIHELTHRELNHRMREITGDITETNDNYEWRASELEARMVTAKFLESMGLSNEDMRSGKLEEDKLKAQKEGTWGEVRQDLVDELSLQMIKNPQILLGGLINTIQGSSNDKLNGLDKQVNRMGKRKNRKPDVNSSKFIQNKVSDGSISDKQAIDMLIAAGFSEEQAEFLKHIFTPDEERRPQNLSQAVKMQTMMPPTVGMDGEEIAQMEKEENARKAKRFRDRITKNEEHFDSIPKSQAVLAQILPFLGIEPEFDSEEFKVRNRGQKYGNNVTEKMSGEEIAEREKEQRKYYKQKPQTYEEALYGPRNRETRQREIDDEFSEIDSSGWKENYEKIKEAQQPKNKLVQKGREMQEKSAQYQAAQTLGQMMENPKGTAYDTLNTIRGVQICDQCGHKNPADAKVCEECGARLDGKGRIGGFLSNKFEQWKHTINGSDQGEMKLSHRLQQLGGMGKRAQRKRKNDESAMDAGMKNMGLFGEMMNNPSEMTEKARTQGLKICPECGHQNPSDAIHCEECGARLDGRGRIGGFFADKFSIAKGKVKSKTTDKVKGKIDDTKASMKDKISGVQLDAEAKGTGVLGGLYEKIGNSKIYDKLTNLNLEGLGLEGLTTGGFNPNVAINKDSWGGGKKKASKEGRRVRVPIEDGDESSKDDNDEIPKVKVPPIINPNTGKPYDLDYNGSGRAEVRLGTIPKKPTDMSEKFKADETEFYKSLFEKGDLTGLMNVMTDPSASQGQIMKQIMKSSLGILSHEDLSDPVLDKVIPKINKEHGQELENSNVSGNRAENVVDRVLDGQDIGDVVKDEATDAIFGEGEGRTGFFGKKGGGAKIGNLMQKGGKFLSGKGGTLGKVGNVLSKGGNLLSKVGGEGLSSISSVLGGEGGSILGSVGGEALGAVGGEALGAVGSTIAGVGAEGGIMAGLAGAGGAAAAEGGLMAALGGGGALLGAEGALAATGVGLPVAAALAIGSFLLPGVVDGLGKVVGGIGDFLGSTANGVMNMGKSLLGGAVGLGAAAVGGVMGFLGSIFSNNKENTQHSEAIEKATQKTANAISKQNKSANSASGGNITIQNININTADDPEAIKAMFLELIIELQEQVNPRLVSRTAGKAPNSSASDTSSTDDNNAQNGGNNSNTNSTNNTNTNSTNTNSTNTNSTGSNNNTNK